MDKAPSSTYNTVLKLYDPSPHPSIDELAERMLPSQRDVFKEHFVKMTANSQEISVYADGCYDMFHLGHARQLEQIKAMYPKIKLVVGVCSDADINKFKGHMIMDERERVETVKHCRWVDDIIFPAPWCPTLEFMDQNKLDFISHDNIAYDAPGISDVYEPMKKVGRFLPTLRTEGISTSELLTRILKDREEYYERNLKKGISRKQMNLNYAHYAFIQMKGVMHNMQKCLKKIEYGDQQDGNDVQ